MVSAVVAFPLAVDHLGLRPQSQLLIGLARWPLMFLILMTALAVLYRFGPSRREARWQWLSIGALLASVLWIAGSAALSWYLSNFGNYSATYGSLGAAIGLMIWMWMSAIDRAVRRRAELGNRASDRGGFDRRRPKPLGARGAVMADTLGPRFRQAKRTLAFRINNDAKVNRAWGSAKTAMRKRVPCFARMSAIRRASRAT